MKKALLGLLGIFAFGSTLCAQNLDVGVTAIIVNSSQTGGAIADGGNITIGDTLEIGMTVENFGTDTFFVSAGDTIATSTLGGSAPSIITVLSTSSIAPGGTANYILIGDYITDGISPGPFEICFSTMANGDADVTNDETCATYNMVPAGGSTGIAENEVAENVFYANNNLNYTLNSTSGAQLTVVSMNGQVVKQARLNNGNGQVTLGELKNGIYLVSIASENGVITKKIAKF